MHLAGAGIGVVPVGITSVLHPSIYSSIGCAIKLFGERNPKILSEMGRLVQKRLALPEKFD